MAFSAARVVGGIGRHLDEDDPLEGLVMGTRSGDIDVGAVALAARHPARTSDPDRCHAQQRSGLLGISGLSSDCRAGSRRRRRYAGAELALGISSSSPATSELFASLAPRFDALVFTGGIGENSARIRAMTLRHLAVFGFSVGKGRQRSSTPGNVIGAQRRSCRGADKRRA